MPGIMALRKRAAEDKPLAGAKIAVCVHVTTQVAVSGSTCLQLRGQFQGEF
jgi:S-adenosylhomocysteine hydrolase